MDRIRQAVVFFENKRCGLLERTATGYRFQYDTEYRQRDDAKPLSRSLPLQSKPFESKHFFPYFAGLTSEGWLLKQQSLFEKIDSDDYLTLLAYNGEDLAGAVNIRPFSSNQ